MIYVVIGREWNSTDKKTWHYWRTGWAKRKDVYAEFRNKGVAIVTVISKRKLLKFLDIKESGNNKEFDKEVRKINTNSARRDRLMQYISDNLTDFLDL